MGEETKASVPLTKQSAGRDDEAKPGKVTIPRSINIAVAAVVAEIVFSLGRALLLRGYTDELRQLLVDSNADSDDPDKHYTAAEITHDLDQLRSNVLLQAIVLALLLGLLGYMLRRQRAASPARWGLIVILVVMRIPFAVVPSSGLPGVPTAAGVLMGAASIVIIVMLLVPASMQYFRQLREANRPTGGGGGARGSDAPARPGLGSLFAPRQRRAGGLFSPRPPVTGSDEASATSRPGRERTGARQPHTAETEGESSRPRSKPKAKARTDEAAIARGASIARNRAKASKSRRTES